LRYTSSNREMLMQYDMWFSNGDADDKTVLFLKVIFFLFQ